MPYIRSSYIAHLVAVGLQVSGVLFVDIRFFKVSSDSDVPARLDSFGILLKLYGF